jgi:small subunit ribosomal protein S2
MKRYIYGARNGIYIIDLHQTLKLFDEAQKFVQEVVLGGGKVLFVGTKKQAQDAIAEAALRSRQYYVNQRWLGGMLTNYRTIRDRVKRLEELNKMEEEGTFARLTKKEAMLLTEQRDKLQRYLGGIKDMPSLPLYYPVYSYGVDTQVQGVQVAPMYDVSDRLALISEWYLVTRRALEQTPVPTASQ